MLLHSESYWINALFIKLAANNMPLYNVHGSVVL